MERIKELLSKVKLQYVLLPILAGILVWIVVNKPTTPSEAVATASDVDLSSSAGAETAIDDLGVTYQWADNTDGENALNDLFNTNPYDANPQPNTSGGATTGSDTSTPTISPSVPQPSQSHAPNFGAGGGFGYTTSGYATAPAASKGAA